MGAAAFAPEEKKQEMCGKFAESVDRLCSMAASRMSANKWKYSSGDKITTADFCVAVFYLNFAKNDICPFKPMIEPIFGKYAVLNECMAEIEKGCAGYLASRPKFPF